jgi:uncharacterized protein (DUF433 family)
MIGNGVYDLAEAALFTGLRRARARQWFEGRSDDPIPDPVFRSDYELANGIRSISFLDLVELFVGGRLREHGISLPFLRRVHGELQVKWRTKHPFSRKEIRTDGKRIFAYDLDEFEQGQVHDVRTGQMVFTRIVLPTLKKIEYDRATNLAMRWRLAPLVVLDPTVCFGKPIIEPIGITTHVLAASYYANGQNAKAVASWFEIKEIHVRAAVEYEAGRET